MALFMRTQLCGEITLQKLEFSLLDVFIDSFVRKPSFLPKKKITSLQAPVEVVHKYILFCYYTGRMIHYESSIK